MKAHLTIEYDDYDGTWVVKVETEDRIELFYKRTFFKFTAWISYFIWKHIVSHFHFGDDVDKWIEL